MNGDRIIDSFIFIIFLHSLRMRERGEERMDGRGGFSLRNFFVFFKLARLPTKFYTFSLLYLAVAAAAAVVAVRAK